MPARVDSQIEQLARNEVERSSNIFTLCTFTVEFFIDSNNQLLQNEIAPRPHNSGHYSIEA